VVVLLIFVLLLALTGWAVAARLAGAAAPLRTDTARLRAELAAVGAAGAAARVEVGRLEARLDAQREAAATFAQAEDRLHDAFAAASRDALEHNSRAFLDLAGTRLAQQQALAAGDLDQRRLAVESLISPLHDALTRVEQNMAGLESARTSAYAGLQQQVRGLTDAQERLRTETAQLTSALRSPQVRGRWGEVQLRRVIELAGMTAHCDFVEQVSVVRAGAVRRPDVIVTLPGGHQLAIDAKVPLAAYLQAHETTDDEKRAILLRDHAGQVRAHVNGLASKEYWEQFSDSPDLVVLFIPPPTSRTPGYGSTPRAATCCWPRPPR
jgi:DNA recombination protein RmuC